LSSFSPEDQEKIIDLEIKIARLKSQDTTSQISKLKQEICDLRQLIKTLQATEESLGNTAVAEINAMIESAVQKQEIANSFTLDQFSTTLFSQPGSTVWRLFIEAAHSLAIAENNSYPVENDHCLLCHQLLSNEAKERLHKLWIFLQDDSQSRLKDLRKDL